MSNLDARLRKLDASLPRPASDPWEGRSPTVRAALAKYAMRVAATVPAAEARDAARRAESELAFWLDFDDVGHGPLDEAGKAHVRRVADEMIRELGR